MPVYLSRIVDDELDLRLEAFGATLIVGPKWCVKTTTAEQKAKSILRMQDPDKRDGYLATAQTKPSLLLKGDNPRLIDEAGCAGFMGLRSHGCRPATGRRAFYPDRINLC